MAIQFKSPVVLPVPSKGARDSSLVFCVFLFIMAIMVVFMAIRVPRLFALLWTSSERFEGFLLRRIPATQCVQSPHLETDSKDVAALESKVLGHPSASNRDSCSMGGVYDANRTRYPLHIPANIKFMRPLVKPFRARISPGFSFGQLLVLAAYFSVLSFAIFYKSNILLNQSRAGWIAVSQLPFIFVFGQKSSFFGTLLGFGYEKLNFLHRFVGKVVVLASNVHTFYFLYKYALDGVLWKRLGNRTQIWGIIALLCMDSFYFFSTPYIRDKAYNFFYRTHIMAVILLLPALYIHKASMLPYVLTCAALYTLDSVLRLVKSRFVTAYIQPLTDLDMTRVEIPDINAGWRAGQHVRLRVLSFRMGWLGWTETHPFTIANISRGRPEGLILLCKRSGDWTRKLFDAAKAGNNSVARIKVFVEGPYGGPGHTIYSSFSAAVLITGGSGISYALSVVQDLIQKDLKKESRIKVIDLVWIVRDPACIVPLLPTLSPFVQQIIETHIRIHIFYTAIRKGRQSVSSIKSPSPTSKEGSRSPSPGRSPSGTTTADDLPHGISLSAGRPNFSNVLDETICHVIAMSLGGTERERITGMVVGVCGPVKMADDVSKAVSEIEPVKRDQVGGVEICEEVFGW